MMDAFTDLDQLLQHIWDQIQQGAKDAGHPYHSPALATVGTEGPQVRTVILRRVDVNQRTLLFHSDRRAGKVGDIQQNPRVAWVFWHPDLNQQVRLRGTATLHFEDAVADRLWQGSAPQSLKLYVKPQPPQTVVPSPQSGVPDAVQLGDLTSHDPVAAGRDNFAAVLTTVDQIDFLHLRQEGNYRARFDWDGSHLKGAWMIP